jgi:SNF family Na+-dependent transporter
MATPQSVIHGSTRPRDVVLLSSLLGLAMLTLWELPLQAARHGGIAFVGAWLLGLLVLALPLLLLEFMLGKRSRRSPLEGFAFLTREADARRFWRAAAWGSSLAAVLALAAVALVAGGYISYLAREAGLVSAAVNEVSSTGPALPLGTGSLLILAAGLSLLAPAIRSLLLTGVLALVLVLLAIAALGGLGMAELLYSATPLDAGDWRAAFHLSLLSLGGGLGVLWAGGMRLPREAALGRLALGLVGLQLLLGLLLMLALAPFVAVQAINAGSGLQIVPSGPSVWLLLAALLLIALLALKLIAEPVLLRLTEKGLQRLPAVVLVFAAGAVLAEAIWFFGHKDGVQGLLTVLGALLLLVLLGQSIFTGWAMKISHARKELALPAEAIYNVWRVAVRLVVPLAILWVLTLYLP